MAAAPLVVSCGDPAGIGPEIVAQAWRALGGTLPFAWIGDPRHLPSDLPHRLVDSPAAAADVAASALPVLALPFPAAATPGRPDPANAPGVVAAIERAATLVMAGAAAAMVTAPINKKRLRDGADFAFPGHTEFLGHLAGGADVVMMLACPALRVVPATIHVPLSQVPALVTTTRLETVIRTTHAALQRDFALPAPRIAVAGLNPHAGENGLMGGEDAAIIAPLVARLAAGGMAITGPHAADSLFHPAARAGYDAAVCMYHDQALIPIKTIDFAGGVNVTLGLPFIRTSPDHGTAYDIAGRGRADPASMIAALRMAARMAGNRA